MVVISSTDDDNMSVGCTHTIRDQVVYSVIGCVVSLLIPLIYAVSVGAFILGQFTE